MLEFMKKYGEISSAILSGFNRIVFRGVLRSIAREDSSYIRARSSGSDSCTPTLSVVRCDLRRVDEAFFGVGW